MEYIASRQSGAGAANGRPVVYQGSRFVCEARDMDTAKQIASALNAASPTAEPRRVWPGNDDGSICSPRSK